MARFPFLIHPSAFLLAPSAFSSFIILPSTFSRFLLFSALHAVPKELTHEKSDKLLTECGWIIQNCSTVNLDAAQNVALPKNRGSRPEVYTTKIIKAGALLSDTRMLLTHWDENDRSQTILSVFFGKIFLARRVVLELRTSLESLASAI